MDGSSPLHPDTTATLLLCGRFGGSREGVKPLSPSEYHDFARWLEPRRIAFADLLKSDGNSVLKSYAGSSALLDRLGALLRRTDDLAVAHERWTRLSIWVVGQFDRSYPSRLRQRLGFAALPLLFGAGPRALLDGGGVCIVGSRDSSPRGIEFAHVIGARCGREAMTVISSDMRGADREVVAATLANNGKVICVLSDSLEKTLAATRYRKALAAGTVALATPFSPEARFNIANAIRANKYQYALSDVAVIVETRQKGGIWLGADENRNEGWVPAFVRTDEVMPSGNLALLHLGLSSIAQQDVEQCASMHDFFVEHALSARRAPAGLRPAPARSAGPGSGPPRHAKSPAFDLYAVFLTELRRIAAAAPRSEDEIAAHFRVELNQARNWLKRAVAEGAVRAAAAGGYQAR
jgi:predicted Rossmann fold nucleotide-binding protein DprA/Smf involved in DNA uptake